MSNVIGHTIYTSSHFCHYVIDTLVSFLVIGSFIFALRLYMLTVKLLPLGHNIAFLV